VLNAAEIGWFHQDAKAGAGIPSCVSAGTMISALVSRLSCSATVFSSEKTNFGAKSPHGVLKFTNFAPLEVKVAV
jgi:hypothetical protein